MMTVNQVEMHLINIQDFNLITYLQLQLRKPFNMTSLNEYWVLFSKSQHITFYYVTKRYDITRLILPSDHHLVLGNSEILHHLTPYVNQPFSLEFHILPCWLDNFLFATIFLCKVNTLISGRISFSTMNNLMSDVILQNIYN